MVVITEVMMISVEGGENGSVGAGADHHVDGGTPGPQRGTFVPREDRTRVYVPPIVLFVSLSH